MQSLNQFKIFEAQNLDALIQASPLGIVAFDTEGRVTKWNKGAERIFGWKEIEVIGKPNPVLPEGHDEEYAEMRNRLIKGGSLKGDEFIRKRKDGSLITVRAYTSTVKDENGNVIGVFGSYDDISEKKRAEEKLKWNELLLRMMADSSQLGFLVTDKLAGNFLYSNKCFYEIWNYKNEGDYSDFVRYVSNLSTDKKKTNSAFTGYREIDNRLTVEDIIELKNEKLIRYFTTQIRDENDRYIGRFFLFEDVTERKRFEALKKSEDVYRELMENSSEPIILCDTDGIILFVNPPASEICNSDIKVLHGKNITEIFGRKIFDYSELTPAKTITRKMFLSPDTKENEIETSIRLYPENRVEILLKKISKTSGKQATDSVFTDSQSRFVFASESMKQINFEITRLANLDIDVLLSGETGVGKDLIAAEIYRRSSRSEKPFIPVSIGALSETLIESELFGHEKGAFSGADRLKIGKLEAADKGTLYIPEISSLSENVQLKLLYFMQYKAINRVGQDARKGDIKLDVRLIFATNENLESLVSQGKIRKDFYYRIAGAVINIPPLRERTEDIEVLAEYFLDLYSRDFGKKFKLSEETLTAFKKYEWFGNVRELSNCIRNVISYNTDSMMMPHHFKNILKSDFHCSGLDLPATNFEQAENEFRRKYFEHLLLQSDNKISKAAKLAGMTPQGLRKILTKLSIK